MRSCLTVLVIAAATASGQSQPAEPVYKFYSTVFGTSVVKPGGLTGLVYELEPGTDRLPSFDRMRAVSKAYTNSLDIRLQEFSRGFPGIPERFEWFAIDYTGNIWITKAGRYRFILESDDGSALFLDSRLVIDNDGIHPVQVKKGSAHLTAGLHQIRIAYFQGPRFHLALRQVSGPGERMHIFDTDQFAPASGAGEARGSR